MIIKAIRKNSKYANYHVDESTDYVWHIKITLDKRSYAICHWAGNYIL